MSKERWQYLKALQPPPARVFWPSSTRGTYIKLRDGIKSIGGLAP